MLKFQDFSGCPVVKNLPANAGNTGLNPGLIPHASGQLGPHATAIEGQHTTGSTLCDQTSCYSEKPRRTNYTTVPTPCNWRKTAAAMATQHNQKLKIKKLTSLICGGSSKILQPIQWSIQTPRHI